MTTITFADEQIELAPQQNVLDALLERGHVIPNSCHAGVCQSCLMRAVSGVVPAAAQQGLKDTLKSQNYFLACCCLPDTPLNIELPAADTVRTTMTVTGHHLFGENVLQLRLRPESDFEYHAGQYVTLWNEQQLGRSYSLASVPVLDPYLELHIGRVAGGRMSSWLFDRLKSNDSLQVQMPTGNCFYIPGNPQQQLLLAGTGTGLAPLIGIARDALHQGHRGEIHLIHGALHRDGLYQHQMLSDIAATYDNFYYHASVLQGGNLPDDIRAINIESMITEVAPKPTDWKIFLCGAADLVNSLKKKVFLAGASMSNIYSDSFVSAYDAASA